MSKLPSSNASLLVRTDFSDEVSWAGLLRVIATETIDGFMAYVEIVNDEKWEGVAPDALQIAMPAQSDAAVLFIGDRVALSDPAFPILVVDLRSDHLPFRCVGSELWGPDNNLNLGNMDFAEFADDVGSDGVFRGFSSPTS